MSIGKVKWFLDDKGYGFIENLDGGEDVFVHYSILPPSTNGYRTLRKDQYVEFDYEATEKGLAARRVAIIPTPFSTNGK